MPIVPNPDSEFHGVDISHHQDPKTLPWNSISKSSQFLIARATYGTSPDRETANHLRRARELGLIVGIYHFFRPSEPWEKQAETFAKVAREVRLSKGDLLPAIDIELDPFPSPGSAPSPEWNTPLSQLAGKFAADFDGCLLYTTRTDWALLGKPEWVKRHSLWAVHWRAKGSPRRPPIEPALPDGMTWAIHQYGVGSYDATGGTQDHSAPDAIDHNRARRLPRIGGSSLVPRSLARGTPTTSAGLGGLVVVAGAAAVFLFGKARH